ncbi:hypothetical protein LCGC14_2248470, partial [marine sediment metagenome]
MSEARHGGFNIASLIAQAGDPAAVANQARVYVKTVGGVTRLFKRQSNGTFLPLEASRVVRVDPNGTNATITLGLAAAAALT